MSDLAIVPDHPDDANTPEEDKQLSHIPNFEGEEVTATKVKITSVAGLEIDDRVFRMDESVKLVIEARVVGIDHKPNAAGKLERVHLLKAIDSLIVDWSLDMDGLKEALG